MNFKLNQVVRLYKNVVDYDRISGNKNFHRGKSVFDQIISPSTIDNLLFCIKCK